MRSFSQQQAIGFHIPQLGETFECMSPSIKGDIKHISGIPDFIPAPSEVSTLASLKPVEDMLNGQTVGLGDDTAAIWVPQQVDRQNH